MSTLVLSKSYTIALNTLYKETDDPDSPFLAKGNLTGIGPTLSYETWTIDRIQTSCNDDRQTRLYIYSGQPVEPNLVSGTYSGNFDTDETNLVLRSGDYLSFLYNRGTFGSIGTVTLRGTIEIHANVYGSR